MRLCEHPEFEQAILAATDHFKSAGLRAALIEKDYYVTEALRIIGQTLPGKVIFKGGTSLSKGWNLIQRFSEDIDLFVDPSAFDPVLVRRSIDRELKRLRDAVGTHPGLTFIPDESVTIGGFGRADRFAFAPHFGGPGEVASRVLLEAGTGSGREPTADVELRSYLSQFLTETGTTLRAEDESAFPFRLLHFRRTFVEKLFAIHGKVIQFQTQGRPIGSYARHYYDLYQLAGHPEVLAMLHSEEYASIKSDYDAVSRQFFPGSYFHPEAMRFSRSEAIFPSAELSTQLGIEFDSQCRLLCYGTPPGWDEVMERFETLRELL